MDEISQAGNFSPVEEAEREQGARWSLPGLRMFLAEYNRGQAAQPTGEESLSRARIELAKARY